MEYKLERGYMVKNNIPEPNRLMIILLTVVFTLVSFIILMQNL
jgi:hypothetical protein